MDYILGELSADPAQREALWEVAKREALQDEADMVNAKKQLKFLLAGGTWPNMLARISALLDKGQIKIHFIVLLKLNIEAAKSNGWRNKVMLFEKLEKFINGYRTKGPEALAEEAAAKKRKEDEEEAEKVAAQGGGFGMHAPVFESTVNLDTNLDVDVGGASASVGSLVLDTEVPLDVTQTHADRCVQGKLLSVLLTGGPNDNTKNKSSQNKKRKSGGGGGGKKKNKRVDKKKSKAVLDLVAKSLTSNGWAVCDDFASSNKVTKVREEIDQLAPHFEESEIWVGKGTASVGAHLRVPSVRGDKILWMCGGHQEHRSKVIDSAGVQPKTRGDVEPCNPKIKSSLGINHFTHLRDILKAMDLTVAELSKRIPRLKHVHTRSDAMLAVYDGNGARFQRHIDNTAHDGRRLTVLCYLNPGWRMEDGGALEIFPTDESRDSPAPDTKPAANNTTDAQSSDDDDAPSLPSTATAESGPKKPSSKTTTPSAATATAYPIAGRLAMFWSEKVPHAVKPSFGKRYALTVWYYDSEERRSSILEAKTNSVTKGKIRATPENRQAAQQFIQALLVGSEGEPINQATLDSLVEKAKTLSPAALDIAAGVTGVAKGDGKRFVAAVQQITPSHLLTLRQDFKRMNV